MPVVAMHAIWCGNKLMRTTGVPSNTDKKEKRLLTFYVRVLKDESAPRHVHRSRIGDDISSPCHVPSARHRFLEPYLIKVIIYTLRSPRDQYIKQNICDRYFVYDVKNKITISHVSINMLDSKCKFGGRIKRRSIRSFTIIDRSL